ncbi:MAG: 4Fe-4S binding protein [Bacteroidales bacterium]|nr:4Fe-4S binding protein [Bacteroidales bacterium]
MTTDVYERLADYLDQLPAGFPRTEGGAEIRILRQLFSPEEASMAMHVSLIAEEPRVIAYRAGISLDKAEHLLHEMDYKGLIFSIKEKDKPLRYRMQQFIVGFWEQQVYSLTPDLVRDFEEYLPEFVNLDTWQKVPQLRVIPVNKSISVVDTILPYEQVFELINEYSEFTVFDCICRKEQRILGKGCNKPLESCLNFGPPTERNRRLNRGRIIGRSEVIDILYNAEKAGLVLQTGNARNTLYICTCCGCCGGVLRSLKRDSRPASRVSSPFRVKLDSDKCSGCGTCLDRCQMDALSLNDGKAVVNTDRCIGCGLCVSTCSTGAMTLQRKPKNEQSYVPVNLTETYIKLGQVRGKMSILDLIGLKIRSIKDRVLSH